MESTKGVGGRPKIEDKGVKMALERGSAKLKNAQYGTASEKESTKNEPRAALCVKRQQRGSLRRKRTKKRKRKTTRRRTKKPPRSLHWWCN